MPVIRRLDVLHLLGALLSVAGITAIFVAWLGVTNHTTVALSYLLVVLFVAASSPLWIAIVTSIGAMLAFNFFFFPPVGTFTIADPQNWIALFAFLAVSLVASRLSAAARDRQHEALNRRDELARLFDLSRDILLTTEPGSEAITMLARHVSGRFQLDFVSIVLPAEGQAERYQTGVPGPTDAPRAVPLRLGTRTIGTLETAGRSIEPGTLDTLASVVAIAIERIHFLEERKQAELAQRSGEFKSALLASLAHDLRTPLTTIRVAATNLHASWLTEPQRDEQADLVLAEVERLTRLFENILEMTRIEAGAVVQAYQWVDPSEIVEAAKTQVGPAASGHRIEVVGRSGDRVVHLDPRLTSAALAHLFENAAQYSPAGSAITVTHEVNGEGLLMTVDDEGRGIAAPDRARLFEPFYRGEQGARHSTGTGMGLAIARGLLAAEHGRVWAENRPEGGARFSILVPAPSRPAPTPTEEP